MGKHLPISSAQAGLIRSEVIEGMSLMHPIFVFRLSEPLPFARLEAALAALLACYDATEYGFTVEHQAVHAVRRGTRAGWSIDRHYLGDGTLTDVVRTVVGGLKCRRFDIGADPLFRFVLIGGTDAVQMLVGSVHHAVFDNASTLIFFEDLDRVLATNDLPDEADRSLCAAVDKISAWRRRIEAAPNLREVWRQQSDRGRALGGRRLAGTAYHIFAGTRSAQREDGARLDPLVADLVAIMAGCTSAESGRLAFAVDARIKLGASLKPIGLASAIMPIDVNLARLGSAGWLTGPLIRTLSLLGLSMDDFLLSETDRPSLLVSAQLARQSSDTAARMSFDFSDMITSGTYHLPDYYDAAIYLMAGAGGATIRGVAVRKTAPPHIWNALEAAGLARID